MERIKLNLSQDRVKKLAKRTRPIVERNQHIPAVASIGAMVAPLADAYDASYEALKTQRMVARRALQAGQSEIGALHAQLRMWRGTLARELPGFERTEVSAPVSDPDGVLNTAELLVAFVRKEGGGLPFATSLVDDVTARGERAEQAWLEGQAQLKQLQVLQGELRSTGARFLSGLVSLRLALRESLGSHDRDHRALRAQPRAEDADVEEEVDAEEGGELETVPPVPQSGSGSDPQASGTG
jgi:hypothetical protein